MCINSPCRCVCSSLLVVFSFYVIVATSLVLFHAQRFRWRQNCYWFPVLPPDHVGCDVSLSVACSVSLSLFNGSPVSLRAISFSAVSQFMYHPWCLVRLCSIPPCLCFRLSILICVWVVWRLLCCVRFEGGWWCLVLSSFCFRWFFYQCYRLSASA